jgi:hypothetical protein
MPPRAACTRSPSACRPRSAAGASSPPHVDPNGPARLGSTLVATSSVVVVRGTALAQPRERLLEVEVGRARLAREEEAAAPEVPAPQCLRELLDAGIGERARRRPIRERLDQLPELRVGVDSAPAQLEVDSSSLQLLEVANAPTAAPTSAQTSTWIASGPGRTVPPRADRQAHAQGLRLDTWRRFLGIIVDGLWPEGATRLRAPGRRHGGCSSSLRRASRTRCRRRSRLRRRGRWRGRSSCTP